MPRIALVTYAGLPDLWVDDRLLRAELLRRGMEVSNVLWDDPAEAWSSFDAVVLRSTWDYHLRVDEFRAWLDRLETSGARVWNGIPTIRRNIHKSYLASLPGAVPTAMLPDTSNVAAVMQERGWSKAVVKPAISATAFRTFVTSTGEDVPPMEDVLVQPFLEEIVADGEWSLVFFDGVYSHAVVKRAAPGDFRVQNEHGGTYGPATPPPEVVAQAAEIVAGIDTLYARVDGVIRDGRMLVMELELTEPALYLDEPAAVRFADAIQRRL